MTSTTLTSLGRPMRARLIALLVALATVAAALVGTSGATAASTAVRAGLGYRMGGGDFVGYYLTRSGRKVYCLDPGKSAPTVISLATVRRYPGVSAKVTHELAYALTRWGDARTARLAAVESQVLNTLVGNTAEVKRRGRQFSAAFNARVAAHVDATRAFRGPYSVRVSTPTSLLPGQSAVGSVRVRSGSGHDLPGVPLRMGHSAAGAVPPRIRTDSHGVAHFRYAATDVGEVHISATAVGLSSTRILASHPTSRRQHMVTWAHPVDVRGSSSFQRRVGGFANRYACTTTCDGRPRTAMTACAPPSRYPSRIEYSVDGRRHAVSYPPSTKLRCTTLSLVLNDGDRVTATWQFRTPRGWSRRVAAGGAFTVDCPAVPDVGVSLVYDCAKALITIGLAEAGAAGTWTPLVNTSKHQLVLVIGGITAKRIYAGPGETATFTASAACGTPVTYTMQAGVRRANQRYNYGPIASITTPRAGG